MMQLARMSTVRKMTKEGTSIATPLVTPTAALTSRAIRLRSQSHAVDSRDRISVRTSS